MIITGAKKCGTTALKVSVGNKFNFCYFVEKSFKSKKIFLKVHPHFYAGRGEVHFFNRASNFKKGYDWYRKGLKMIILI